jgi:glycosyltransferase involved in cell wall biosynthesis
MSPYGSKNDSEKMTVTFIDYLCQIALNMKDPGLLRMLLHKGDDKQKLVAFGLANMFSEIKRHKVTISFLKLFHECFTGKVPGYSKRLFIPKHYKPVFDEAAKMAQVRRDDPAALVQATKTALHNIYESLITLFVSRVTGKIQKIFREDKIEEFDINKIVESLEVPVSVRSYIDAADNKKKKKGGVNLSEFLDGLSFPFLASSVILAAAYTSARVMYNSRPLLRDFSENLGKLKHPERILWLTDTFEDVNGVAMVLNSMLDEIRARNLPIDLLVCSSKLKSADNLIVVDPLSEFTLPFYEHQPMRVPNILEIHRLFKENEYSRIICSTEGPMGIISLFLKKAYSVPAYFFVHTDWMMFARQVLNFDHHNRSRLRRILRAYYKAFDGLFVLNNDQRDWLTGTSMGFDPSKVFLTAHWADREFVPHKTSKKKIFGVSEETPVLLFAGRISEEKGVMEIPAIYEKIKTKFPEARVAFAGKGPSDEALRKAIPDGIFLGWVDHAKLPEIYSAADMLLLPSKFDTFGCVVLEALSCSLPVAAYKTKGPKDIIEQGKSGFLVKTRTEMADAVTGFLENSGSINDFKIQAVERAKAYSADVILKQFLKDLDFEHASPEI